MTETGYQRSPRVQRGGIVQLVETLGAVMPNVVPFQYNPERVTRTLQPWNPFETEPSQRGAQSPMVQPYDPEETIRFDLEVDATDELEGGDPVVIVSGVSWRLAQLRKLTEPSEGPFGDLIATARSFGQGGDGVQTQVNRPSVPVALLVLGPGLILPIRVTDISIEVTEHSPTLHPLMAKVSLELRVLTPDVFKCREDRISRIAIAAYRATKLQEDTLAATTFAKGLSAVLPLLPL